MAQASKRIAAPTPSGRELKHLQMKSGGRILRVSAVAHETYKGVATWHFVGIVDFEEGREPMQLDIAPYAVCYDHDNAEAKAEGDRLFSELNEYLKRAGKWHDAKRMPDGRMVHWTPHKPNGSEAVS